MSDLVRQSPYTILTVDERGWVTSAKGNVTLKDPTGYAENEARFGAEPPARANPIRLRAGYRLTKVIELDPPYQKDPDGHDITQETVVVPWKYCKVADYAVVEMDDTEKATRDAEIAAEKAAELEAKRTAEENKDIFKIIFRMCNLHRPENMQITVEEAKQIVDDVIKLGKEVSKHETLG